MKHCTNCGHALEEARPQELPNGEILRSYTCRNRQCGALCGYTLGEATFTDPNRIAKYKGASLKYDFHTGEPRHA